MSNRKLINRLREKMQSKCPDVGLLPEAADALEALEWRTDIESAPLEGSLFMANGFDDPIYLGEEFLLFGKNELLAWFDLPEFTPREK